MEEEKESPTSIQVALADGRPPRRHCGPPRHDCRISGLPDSCLSQLGRRLPACQVLNEMSEVTLADAGSPGALFTFAAIAMMS